MWSVAFLYTFEFFLVFLVRQFYLTIPKELSEAAIMTVVAILGYFTGLFFRFPNQPW